MQLPADLTSIELELKEAAARGSVLDLSGREPHERVVRAGLIYNLSVASSEAHAKGVRLTAAIVYGCLDFGAATLKVPLILKHCAIGVSIEPTLIAVNLEQARGTWISFDECVVHGGVSAVQLCLTTSLSLCDSTVRGVVDLTGAEITGTVVMNCSRITDVNSDGNSFIADGIKVGGSLFARDMRVAGAMRLPVAEISRTLEMDGAKLNGADCDGDALTADGLTVHGNLFLRDNFSAAGCVRLPGATVSGSMQLGPATLTGHSLAGDSLLASRAKFGRVVFLPEVTSSGAMTFAEAHIEGRLDLAGAARIPSLTLQGATCSEFADSEASWPPEGNLRAVGFKFDRIDEGANPVDRLEWVRRQGFTNWSSDPYEQLGAFYTRGGNESSARAIRIAKNDDELTHLKRTHKAGSLPYRFWRRPFGWLLGYGYRRWVAGWLLVALVILACVSFWRLHDLGAMTPNVSPDVASQPCGVAYTCFNAAAYGADVVLPIVDFGQQTAWRPNAQADWGWLAESLQWFAIASGWLLASIFVAAFTNLIRRD